MPDENTSGSAAPVDNSPSLASVVGEMFGDYRDAEPETDAGAPPAASPESPASSEGTPESAPTGTPPVEADPAAVPDQGTPTSDTDADPFDGSTPLGYTVDGQARSYDGITVLKSGGAIIETPEQLAHVQRVFTERDHLFEQSKAQHERYSSLEKLTEWRTTGADGKESVLTGGPAVEAMRVNSATTGAVLQTVLAALTPEKFGDLVDYVKVDANGNPVHPDAEGTWYPIRNEVAWNSLLRESRLTAQEKAGEARQFSAKLSAPPPPQEASVADVAMPTVEATITGAQVTGLTAADKAFLASQLEQYVRPATPAERQATGSARVVDYRFTELVKQQAALRAESAKQVTAAADVSKANAAKLAAAAIGKRPNAQPPRITPTPEPERTRNDDFSDHWDRQEAAAAGALRAHAAGR